MSRGHSSSYRPPLTTTLKPRPFSMLDVLLDAEPLSSVVFVQDYIQLVFQDLYFNLYNPVDVHHGDSTLGETDIGFADQLRRLIGQRVIDTSATERQFAAITFECGTRVAVSLRPEDASGPEAFELANNKGLWVVEQNS